MALPLMRYTGGEGFWSALGIAHEEMDCTGLSGRAGIRGAHPAAHWRGQLQRLVGKSQAVDSSSAQVKNVYQRRADMNPNLEATVSGAANFEKSDPDGNCRRASVGGAGDD